MLQPFERHLDEVVYRECEINGERVIYDVCAVGDLDSAIDFYKHFNYIGSGTVYYINGVRNQCAESNHFFIKKGN